MTKSLAKNISEYFELEYGSSVFLKIYGESLKYIAKVISASEYHKRIKKYSKKSVKLFRLSLSNEGYYILNLKMFLIHAYANKRNPKWVFTKELCIMGIMKRDREYIKKFLSDRETNSKVKEIIDQLGGHRKFIPTVIELKALLIKVMNVAELKLRPLINNLLWTKLKFLIQCGSVDFESVKGELKEKMIQTFYWLAPYHKESINHWVMSMIKPIKNHAINLINFHTTIKRTRMIEDNGIYRVVETSMDALEEDTLGDLGVVKSNLETKIIALQVLKKYAITEKRVKAFKLMTGVYDEAFTEWLKQKKYIGMNCNYDNTDFQESVNNEDFLKIISWYVNLDWTYFKNLLGRIKDSLSHEGGMRNVATKDRNSRISLTEFLEQRSRAVS